MNPTTVVEVLSPLTEALDRGFVFERFFGEQREELFDRDGEPVEADQWRYFGPANGDE